MKNLSVLDSEAIRRNPLNNSPSKLGYSFARLDRFILPPANCPRTCYEENSKLSKRATSFGYGERSDFTKTYTSSPPVTKYNPETLMFMTRKPSNGKTFGISRQVEFDLDQMSPENGTMTKGILKNPGVGTYDALGQTKSTISYSMRSRTLDVFLKNNTSRASPGPTAYNHKDEFPHMKFSSAKYQNPLLGQMNKTARFTTPKQSPGPQTYVTPDDLSNKGKYVASNHFSEGNRRFSMNARTGFTQTIARRNSLNPGPGQYQIHSEFGVYGDVNQNRTSSSFGKFSKSNNGNETR